MLAEVSQNVTDDLKGMLMRMYQTIETERKEYRNDIKDYQKMVEVQSKHIDYLMYLLETHTRV